MKYKKVIYLFLILTITAVGIYLNSIFFSPNTSFSEDTIQITIPSNSSKENLLKIISPYVRNLNSFIFTSNGKQYFTKIRPGIYTLKRNMSNNDIINKLRQRSESVKVTFNNVKTIEELVSKISNQIEADSLSLLESFKEPSFLKQNSFNNENLMTMYIPNTYQIFWDSTPDEFRNRMLEEYKVFWNSTRLSKAEKLNLSPQEVYSLASIVNVETVKIDERPRVAGVYLNLLEKGEKLRADPTVIYALKKKMNNDDLIIKRVLYKDLKIDSPYNTYKYHGIPPGPITMPDISSIESVLNPEIHDYVFFVVDVENFGYHKFSSTLEEHNRNKKKYVNWINSKNIYR